MRRVDSISKIKGRKITSVLFDDARDWLLDEYGHPVEERGERGDGGGQCFSADTLVLMERASKRISDVQVGDKVLTLDGNGDVKLGSVVRTYQVNNNHYYVINGNIKVTGLHPFLTPESWKPVRDLHVDDKIKTFHKGVFEEVTSKERIGTDIEIYTLEVAGNHTFMISPDGKSAYVVHNK